MAMIRIRPIDVLVQEYLKAFDDVIAADIHIPPLNPLTLAVYPSLKQLQVEATALGYDLDAETALQVQADSEANS